MERTKVVYNNLINNSGKRMQANFKVKTKHSWSPGKVQENVYVVRAKVGKKLPSRLHPEGEERFSEGLRPSSLSTQKIKNGASKLFKNAHKIGTNETYLPLEKQNRLSLTNQSSPPHSPMNAPSKIPELLTRSDQVGIRAKSGSKGLIKREIQRTVSIAYNGKAKEVPIENALMTSLSKLILGDEGHQDDFHLEILGESSIHGEEENFIDFGDSLLFDEQPLDFAQ